MSPNLRLPENAYSEGTEVTPVTKASYVGKVTKVAKFGKKVKYQIEWFGSDIHGVEWYDQSSIRKLDKRKSLLDKKLKYDHNVPEEVKCEERKKAKKYLRMMPCYYPEEDVDIALEEVGYPYGLQTVMGRLLKRVGEVETDFGRSEQLIPVKFTSPTYPTEMLNGKEGDKLIGKKIRKMFAEGEFNGRITSRSADFYHVEYDDGDAEDFEGYEVVRYIWPRPPLPPCLGRRFGMLELFAGTCVVSGAFYHEEWNTANHDLDPKSNATIKSDILSLDPETLPFVPDFIWASPPCETYSLLSGGYHRSVGDNELDRSETARLHNLIFMKMVQILAWAKQKHPHLIICIENPVGKIKHMPLMKEFIRHFQLHDVTVNYCTFERDERKPTQLWSNYKNLCDHFEEYKCGPGRCGVMGYHQGIRSNTAHTNFSSIPEPLAKECAKVVNSKMVLDGVHRISAAKPAWPKDGGRMSILDSFMGILEYHQKMKL